MSEQTIDRLQIEIDAQSNASASGVDRLAESIERLLSATKGGVDGLTGVSASIAKMKADLSGVTSGANGLYKMAQSLQMMRNLNLTGVGKSLSTFSNQVKDLNGIGDSLNSIKDFSKGISSIKNGIGKINDLDLTNTAGQIKTLVAAIKPLTDEMLRGGSAANSYGTQLKEMAQAVKTMNGIKGSPQGLRASTSGINSKLGVGLDFAKLASAAYTVERAGTVIAGFIQNTNSYIENMNLFSVAMGDAADEGERFTQSLQEALGVDAGEAMRNMGLFKQLTSSFGAASDQSTVLAKNLTQLGYDLSSFFNLNIDEAFTKLQSGIAGEIEPLRRIGIDLSEARLQQELYNLGIQASVSELTQADKALLRYIAIMKQTTSAQGDMARTIMTPANALRVLQAQLQVAGRAIGSIFIPALTAILPPAIAVVKVVGEAANALARFFGFEMPTIDYSSLTQMPTVEISSGIDDITSSMDDYTGSVNAASKAQKTLIGGFDELNILRAPVETDASKPGSSLDTGKVNTGSVLGDIELPEYDMLLGGVESDIDAWVDKIKDAIGTAENVIRPFIPTLEGLAAAATIAFAIKGIQKFGTFIKTIPGMSSIVSALGVGFKEFGASMKSTSGQMSTFNRLSTASNKGLTAFRKEIPKSVKAAAGIAGVVTNFTMMSSAVENATKQTEGWEAQLGVSLGSFALVEGALLAITGPWGAAAGAIAGAIGALKGYNDAQEEMRQNQIEETFFDGTGVALETLSAMFDESTADIQAYTSEVLKLKDQYDLNAESMRNNVGELENFSNKLTVTGELTAQEAEEMRKQFDNLVTSLQENFSLNTQMIFEGFSNMSAEAAANLGVSVGEMATILQGFSDKFNGITSGIQAETDALIAKAQTGEGLTQSEIDTLTQNIQTMSQLSSDVLGEKIKMLDATAQLEGVDWGNVDAATSAVQGLGEKISGLYSETQAAYDAQKNAIQTQMAQFKVLADRGLLSQADYDKIKGTYSTVLTALDESFQENKSAIDDQSKAALEYIQSSFSLEVDATANEIGNTIFEKIVASIGSNGDLEAYNNILDDYAKKAAKETLQPIQDAIDAEAKNISTASGSTDIGIGIVDGIKSGIEKEGHVAIEAIRDAAWDTLMGARDKLGIHSPSSVFENKVGIPAVQGISQAFTKDSGFVISDCKNLMDDITNAASSSLSRSEFKKIGENAVRGINDGLKGIKFPDIKIPHFEMSYDTWGQDTKAWKDMGLPGKPEVDVKWYARGGIFDSPQIIGVGEKGREAVVPLEDNSPWITALAENVSTQINSDGDDANERIMAFINLCTDRVIEAIQENGNTYVTVPLDGDDIAERVLVRKGGRR